MMEENDKLINDFFASQKQEIADNGFTKKVMKRLPYRISPLAKIWGLLVLITAITLFCIFDGWIYIIQSLRDIFVSIAQGAEIYSDPKSYIIAAIVLLAMGVRKLCTMD